MGQDTETVKSILRRDGFNKLRKIGDKLEQRVKRKGNRKKNKGYGGRDCVPDYFQKMWKKICISETKFTI